jgi:hypothetical protein
MRPHVQENTYFLPTALELKYDKNRKVLLSYISTKVRMGHPVVMSRQADTTIDRKLQLFSDIAF